jgi:hypothetical protein
MSQSQQLGGLMDLIAYAPSLRNLKYNPLITPPKQHHYPRGFQAQVSFLPFINFIYSLSLFFDLLACK